MEKILVITYSGLSKNVNLLLCMAPPGLIGQDSNIVAWKVFAAIANQLGTIQATYTSRYAVGENQPDTDNRVEKSTFRELAKGQSADLIDGPNGPAWGPPMYTPDESIGFRNMTSSKRNMSVGIVRDRDPGSELAYEPTFAWTSVPARISVRVQLTPMLLCYANLDYKEKDIIRADINSNLIQTINLADLGQVSYWVLAEDPEGRYILSQAPDFSASNNVELSSALPSPLPRTLPDVRINYSLKLSWNSNIQDSDAEETIERIVATCNTKGLICRVDKGNHHDHAFDLTVFRKGLTAHRLSTTFASILLEDIDANWSVGEEIYINAASKDHKEGLELVAPKSLAWYYAK
ncbi:hypothetical protein BDP27DRAFT_1420112 [Rhodocollybia butyracea]|uniref:Uncharacterized protein n=1 Tax=Rhodocollybia butyracea TaxID=206335 RepID=A0A9P5PVM2_9AGAR|nr:hypothetical protein BDP27DRAFT_1420112 [Rhodocollybia butyracea]